MFTYSVTSQKPTAVQHAKVCQFTGPSDKNLIIAKGNRIEIHTLSPEGLVPVTEVALYGRITALEYFRSQDKNSDTDTIFILTEKKQFCLLKWDMVLQKFLTGAHG